MPGLPLVSTRSALSRRRLLGAVGLGTAALVTGLAGCGRATGTEAAGSSSEAATTRTVESAHGPITVPTSPSRVIAVGYDTPFQLMAVKVTPVGVFDYSALYEQFSTDVVAKLETIEKIGSWGEPSLEKVAALTPDLIVGAAEEIDDATYAKLSAVAPTVLVEVATRGDWQAMATGVADAAGAAGALATSRAAFEERLAGLREEYAAAFTGSTWVSYSFGDKAGQFSVQFPQGAVGGLMASLGMKLAAVTATETPDSGYVAYSEERTDLLEDVTVALHPVAADGTPYPVLEKVRTSALWQQLPFSASGKDFGMIAFYDLTTYESGLAALDELETKVLATF